MDIPLAKGDKNKKDKVLLILFVKWVRRKASGRSAL
jgi:hypothetical protein